MQNNVQQMQYTRASYAYYGKAGFASGNSFTPFTGHYPGFVLQNGSNQGTFSFNTSFYPENYSKYGNRNGLFAGQELLNYSCCDIYLDDSDLSLTDCSFESSYAGGQCVLQKQFNVRFEYLPVLRQYHLSPSLSQLMARGKLFSVNNVYISNQFGSIYFLDPVDLTSKNLEYCVSIQQDYIIIWYPYWQSLHIRLSFTNFHSYDKLSKKDRVRLIRHIYPFAKSCSMTVYSFDERIGYLVLQG